MAVVYNDFLNTAEKYYADARAQEKTSTNKIYDEQEKVVNDTYNYAVKDTKISYDDMHRENAIQKLINENEVAEDMANMGLSDSGLNRTQQTAVQLSFANNKSGIDRQKQAQLDTLAQSLATELSSIEQNRLSSIAAIDKEYDSVVASSAQEAYQSALDAETENTKNYYSYLEKQAQSEKEKLLLKWNGLKEKSKTGEVYNVYYDMSSGKEYKVARGYNPYTGQKNTNCISGKTYKFFDNGYQPKGIIDIDGFDYGELDDTGIPSYLTGKKQEIWSTKKGGTKYWLWSGEENAYVELVYDTKTDEYKATSHKVYI